MQVCDSFKEAPKIKDKNKSQLSITKKQIKKEQMKSNKQNTGSMKSDGKHKKGVLMSKKRSVGGIKFGNLDCSQTINWHRPQNSDIVVYDNPVKIKKQCRLKTE